MLEALRVVLVVLVVVVLGVVVQHRLALPSSITTSATSTAINASSTSSLQPGCRKFGQKSRKSRKARKHNEISRKTRSGMEGPMQHRLTWQPALD